MTFTISGEVIILAIAGGAVALIGYLLRNWLNREVKRKEADIAALQQGQNNLNEARNTHQSGILLINNQLLTQTNTLTRIENTLAELNKKVGEQNGRVGRVEELQRHHKEAADDMKEDIMRIVLKLERRSHYHANVLQKIIAYAEINRVMDFSEIHPEDEDGGLHGGGQKVPGEH